MSTGVLNQELRGLGVCHYDSIPFLSPQLLREEERKQSKACKKMHSGITHGWWVFGWTEVMSSLCSLSSCGGSFRKEKKRWIDAPSEVLGGVKVFFHGFSSRLYCLRDCNTVSAWAFCSGTTPGPDEVTELRAASGNSVRRTARCPQAGGDQDVVSVHLSLILLRCSQSPSGLLALWDLIFLHLHNNGSMCTPRRGNATRGTHREPEDEPEEGRLRAR